MLLRPISNSRASGVRSLLFFADHYDLSSGRASAIAPLRPAEGKPNGRGGTPDKCREISAEVVRLRDEEKALFDRSQNGWAWALAE